jgi:BirA family biotin operon repressor/biotin-[acetyl-CoA-carboxylase] ligase
MGRLADGWRIVCLDRVGSTNDVARRAGELGLSEKLAVFAEVQTAGRGRTGRRWEAPSGLGLTGSTLWRPSVELERTSSLAQVAAVAAVRALAACGVEARLKWPNDILIGDAKCGGILIETSFEGSALAYAVVGIGLNVLQSAEQLPVTPYAATSVRLATGRVLDRAVLAGELLNTLATTHAQWLTAPTDVFEDWRSSLATLGRRVAVDGKAGLAVDVDPSGALLFQADDGALERYLSGEVSGVRAVP